MGGKILPLFTFCFIIKRPFRTLDLAPKAHPDHPTLRGDEHFAPTRCTTCHTHTHTRPCIQRRRSILCRRSRGRCRTLQGGRTPQLAHAGFRASTSRDVPCKNQSLFVLPLETSSHPTGYVHLNRKERHIHCPELGHHRSKACSAFSQYL